MMEEIREKIEWAEKIDSANVKRGKK